MDYKMTIAGLERYLPLCKVWPFSDFTEERKRVSPPRGETIVAKPHGWVEGTQASWFSAL